MTEAAENLSRFQVIRDRSSMASPACSIFNRSDSEEWYIWTGTFSDLGAIYIGETDFIDLASVVGYVSPDRFNRLVKAYKKLKEENEQLITRLNRFNSLGDSIRAILVAVENASEPTTTGSKQVPNDAGPVSEGTSEHESEADRLTRIILTEASGSSEGSAEQISSA